VRAEDAGSVVFVIPKGAELRLKPLQ